MGLSVHDPFVDPLGNPLGLQRENSTVKALLRGEVSWTVPGTYEWIVPKGVTSICSVCIGGGSGRNNNYSGNGGSLGWDNSIAVTPGQTIRVVVGVLGATVAGTATPGRGGESYISQDDGTTKLVSAPGGNLYPLANLAPYPNGFVGGVGASGASAGAGGAGGYTSTGGNGSPNASSSGTNSQSGGGGGGYDSTNGGGVGGGSWLFGRWATFNTGIGGRSSNLSNAGSADAEPPGSVYANFGMFFGAGSAANPGSAGAVRILWGEGRAFPSTDVGEKYTALPAI